MPDRDFTDDDYDSLDDGVMDPFYDEKATTLLALVGIGGCTVAAALLALALWSLRRAVRARSARVPASPLPRDPVAGTLARGAA